MSEDFLEEEKLSHYQKERAHILFRFKNLQEAIQVASRLEWNDIENRTAWGKDFEHLRGGYYNSEAIKDSVCLKPPLNDDMYQSDLRRIKVIHEMFNFMEEILMRRGYEHCFCPWNLCMTE